MLLPANGLLTHKYSQRDALQAQWEACKEILATSRTRPEAAKAFIADLQALSDACWGTTGPAITTVDDVTANRLTKGVRHAVAKYNNNFDWIPLTQREETAETGLHIAFASVLGWRRHLVKACKTCRTASQQALLLVPDAHNLLQWYVKTKLRPQEVVSADFSLLGLFRDLCRASSLWVPPVNEFARLIHCQAY